MSGDWLSLGLEDVIAAAPPLPPKATAAPRASRPSRPSGVAIEDDLTSEKIPVPKEYAPEAVLRYRSEGRRGDPRNLFALYREMPGRAAGPQIRRSEKAIEGASWEFAPMPLPARDETIRTPEAQVGREVAAYLTETLRPHMKTALSLWARREHYGVSAAKFAVEAGSGFGSLERVVEFSEILGDRLRLDWRAQRFHVEPRRNSRETVECDPLIADGSLILFEADRGFPLDQRGLRWQILIAWCVYQFGFRWWARLNERFALPYLDVAYDPTLENGAEKADKIARQMGSSGAIVRPKESIEAKFLSTMSAAQPDSLERLQEFCLRAFSAGLLGHDQATGAREGAGAKTSDVAAQGVAEWLVAQQLSDASVAFAAQWYGPMVRRNFGEKVAAKHTPQLVLQPTAKLDRELEARIVAIATTAGAEIPEAEFLKRIGYRPARPGERVLTRRQLAAPGAPPAAEPAAGGKLADVVRFQRLAESGRPPVLGADGAPAGIGEDLVGPYRDIFAKALSDGATMTQALSRVMQRARTRPEGKVVVDRLASVLVASTGHGLEDVREGRDGR